MTDKKPDRIDAMVDQMETSAKIAGFHLARGKKRSLTMSMQKHLEAWKLETGRGPVAEVAA